MSSQVWYSKVWFEVDDDKYRYTFHRWVGGSVVGPLRLLWDAFFWVRRGLRNASEESYSKDISKSADFFLQFSFMNLRFGDATFIPKH